ncbi:hypothetical protein MesoLjLc_45450 [Mesorhizobium sp. L-8-10]|uniref:ParB N-terminal domain-containing protein n=1 Tax=Mesorhizobium sp. L-8-10 TaxID=2744523 RepID=UPI001925B571|nr:ParB N-terminal domain-containing protein [Mesorhizobium sp. L-8-10]BCH32615.1 hypothetical protein MesoLjLc_45450 [Mesorhizobium sp. L-8-10]
MNIARQFNKTGRSAASKTKTLDLKRIRVDGGTQSRAGIDDAVVEAYAEDIADGVTFPPITVFYNGVDYWLADGFHRYRAHQKAKKAKIAVEVKQGMQRDAILYSVGANATHGLQRTRADKRRAVEMLLNDAEWSTWSVNKIADLCRVSRELVKSLQGSVTCRTTSDSRGPTAPDVPDDVREKADAIRDAGGQPRYYRNRYGDVAVMDTSAIGGSLSESSDNFRDAEKNEGALDQDANLHLLPASHPEEDHAAFHQQAQENLPQAIRDIEAAKQQAIAARKQQEQQQDHGGLSPEDRIAELEEAVRVLEAEAQELRAENKKYGDMRVQFEQGGFEKVVADKDEEIRVLLTRVEQESAEKVRNLNSMEWWKKKAIEHGFSRNVEIDIQTGAILNG